MHGSTTGECERVWEVLRVPFPDRAYLSVLTELIAKRPDPTHFEEWRLNRPESCLISRPLLCFRLDSFVGLSIYRYIGGDALAARNRKESAVIESGNYFLCRTPALLWDVNVRYSISVTRTMASLNFVHEKLTVFTFIGYANVDIRD